VSVAARLEAAGQVGGDLCDFVMVDDHRLYFAIGDVTDKGVPAALFMSLSKAALGSAVLRHRGGLGQVFQEANAEISRDNTEAMFVTVFAGILDLQTGQIEYCNAGHEPPFILADGTAPQAMAADGGPPLCVVADFPYEAETRVLAPGETLVAVTDGVTEALNTDQQMFGAAQTLASLASVPAGASASQTLETLLAALGDHVGAAEPPDDITALALRYNGG